MPDTHVSTCLKLLALQEGEARPPVVLLVPLDKAKDQDRWRSLGIAAGLVKPVVQSDLFKVLEQLMPAPVVLRPAEAIAAPATNGHSLNVLLAEDNPINQRLAAKLLERMGHSVELAGDGAEAVAAWAAGQFDLVLMDVQMPGVDGFAAVGRIRAAEVHTGQHTPIIALTAHTLQGDRERCLEAGMDGYVSKPIRARRTHRSHSWSPCGTVHEVNGSARGRTGRRSPLTSCAARIQQPHDHSTECPRRAACLVFDGSADRVYPHRLL